MEVDKSSSEVDKSSSEVDKSSAEVDESPEVDGDREVLDRRVALRRLHVVPPVVRDEEQISRAQIDLPTARASEAREASPDLPQAFGVHGRRQGIQMDSCPLVERVVDRERVEGREVCG